MSHHDELVEKAKQAIRAVADDMSAPNGQRLRDLTMLRDVALTEENKIMSCKGHLDGA